MNVMFAAQTAWIRQEVIGKDDDRWRRLREIIETRSLLRGSFRLSSGATSNFLFQLRQTTMFPEGQFLIGSIVEEFMRKVRLQSIGGLELGAVPVVSAVSYASYLSQHPVDAFFVRKSPKSHGAKELIDGELKAGAAVLMVDDVTTTGGSIELAIDNMLMERPNCTVPWALSIVDRDQGAAEALGNRGISLASVFTRADFGL
jgi:orotate phosphoribosyltransferase